MPHDMVVGYGFLILANDAWHTINDHTPKINPPTIETDGIKLAHIPEYHRKAQPHSQQLKAYLPGHLSHHDNLDPKPYSRIC
jgi:hypothetical protein